MSQSIHLSRNLLAQIKDHARATYPEECCGIITGAEVPHTWVVHRCTNIQNRLHQEDPIAHPQDARSAYYIDPEEQFAVLNQAAEQQHEVVGFYHSHPDHAAYFSAEDERHALFFDEPAYPAAFYLVISVKNGQVAHCKVFVWDETARRFEERPLTLTCYA